MQSVLIVGVLWLVFAGTHLTLAAEPLRSTLVRRLGEWGFLLLFYVVASASFAALIAFYAAHRFDGPPGLGLGTIPVLRWLLMGIVVAGLALSGAALAIYPSLPTALFNQPIAAPRGLERITRHPFFAGTAMFALVHALLAAHLIGTVFFAALAAFSTVGARAQDAKLLARRGPAYGDYLAATSGVPFGAIAAGRQRLALGELPVGPLAVGFAGAFALRYWHDSIFADGGVWIVAALVGGGAIAGVNAWRRSRRMATRQLALLHKEASY